MAYAVSSGLNGPDKSSGPPSTVATVSSPSSPVILPKSADKKKISPVVGRHNRSSSLENNIFMSSFSNISGGSNKPQLSLAAEPLGTSPSPSANSSSSPFSNARYQSPLAPSPQYLHSHHLNQQYHPHHHHHHHSSQPHSLQLMSLGHHHPNGIANEVHGGQKLSSLRMGLSSLGGGGGQSQSPLMQPYYGTLKSKREQKRMQMSSQKMGPGQISNGLQPMQQRISSVDDLRPASSGSGSSSSISKSQVRLMREMFEQQQQKQRTNNQPVQSNKNQANQVGGEGGGAAMQPTTAAKNNTSSSNLNRKYTEEKHSSLMNLNVGVGGGGGSDMVDSSLSNKQPPAIQPCSGVLEFSKQQLIKPIAFKPIPFPADSRFNINNNNNNNNNINLHNNNNTNNYETNDRYGSTPSLNPPINYNLKFGSTHDLRLRHNFNTIGNRKAYTLHNYDSMDSLSPDSICSSQSTLKSMSQFHADLMDTPSPSDSGISELEAALRDRDSELAYLRQTMEHNEKVIFRVHQDKERNWEEEIKRMRAIHAQRIQKFEQIAMMQSFQLRQAKKRHQEETAQLQERIKDVERKTELQHNEIMGHKVNEKELREQCSDMMEENELMRKLVNELRTRLEESEWSNCQKNGEAALLKTQLRDAQGEVLAKDQEIVQLRVELKVQAFNDDHLVLPANEHDEAAIIITTNAASSSGSSSSSSSSPVSINHSDDEKLKDDLQLSHLNRIIILKDQIIMAMTNEMQKLKKEVADLGNFEALPPGRVMGQKDQGKIQQHEQQQLQQQNQQSKETTTKLVNKESNAILGDYHDLLNNLKNSEDFLKCTSKEKPTLEELKNVLLNNQFGSPIVQSGREKVVINHLQKSTETCDEKISETKRTNLDSAEQTTAELAEMKRTFEAERKKWTEEKEKVLVYQRQLQRNYLQICKRNESLEEKLQKSVLRGSAEASISI